MFVTIQDQRHTSFFVQAVSAALNEGVSVPDTWSYRSRNHLDVCKREIIMDSQLSGAANQVGLTES